MRVCLSTACSRYRWLEAMSDWHFRLTLQTVIDQTIDPWRFRLMAWVRARGRHLLSYFMMFHWMFETIMMTLKLMWRNWRWLWHVYVCCSSPGITNWLIDWLIDWSFWCQFAPNSSRYTWANNYFNVQRFGKVTAKIKWCRFWPHSVYFHHWQCD